MIEAYHNLAISYLPKQVAKSHVQKKNDRMKAYETFLKLGKNTGFYKITMTKENQDYTFGVKETATRLKTRVEEMSDAGHPAYQQKYVSVSDGRLLEAKLVGKDVSKLPDKISITVQSLAAPQVNVGHDIFEPTRSLERGNYDFTANVMDNSYELTFRQKDRTSNANTIKRMANYLQEALPELSITVEEAKKDYSHIRIQSDITGEYTGRIFSFEDVDRQGDGVVELFGLNRMMNASENAHFMLNGAEKQTHSNTFQIENTLQVTLRRVSDQPVTLRILNASEKLLNQTDQVLGSYNKLLSLAADRDAGTDNSFSARKLANELKRIGELHQEELEENGITVSDDGRLIRDEKLSDEAAKNGTLQNFFTQKNGFIATLLEKAEEIAINPVEYLDKTIVTYPDNKKPVVNPYMTSLYSGLFFSSYC